MDQYLEKYLKILNEETEATIDAEEKKEEAREKAKEAQILQAAMSGTSALESAKTIEEAGSAIITTIKDVIAALIAQGVAAQVSEGLKIPPPYGEIVAAAAGAAAIALFNAIIPKFAYGKYPDMEYAGSPKTGMYGNKPQLGIFNEVPGQPEMVIDGITYRNLRLNTPEIIEAIYAARDGRSPQLYEKGKYNDVRTIVPSSNQTRSLDEESKKLIDQNTQAMKAMLNMKIYTSIVDVNDGQKRFAKIQDTRGI